MKNIKTVSEALKMVEQISDVVKKTNTEVDLYFTVSPLSDIEKIVKQESGTMCYADSFVGYHFGTVKLGDVRVTFRCDN